MRPALLLFRFAPGMESTGLPWGRADPPSTGTLAGVPRRTGGFWDVIWNYRLGCHTLPSHTEGSASMTGPVLTQQ